MICPSRIHWIVGRGVPLTSVRNCAGLPSSTVTSLKVVKDGGTSPESGAAIKNEITINFVTRSEADNENMYQ